MSYFLAAGAPNSSVGMSSTLHYVSEVCIESMVRDLPDTQPETLDDLPLNLPHLLHHCLSRLALLRD